MSALAATLALALGAGPPHFRKVKGILVPFREENWAQGQRTGETALRKVEIVAEPPPGTFGDEGTRL